MMKVKKTLAILGIMLGIILFSSIVHAKSVALVVKNANSLSEIHERKVLRVLNDMGFSTTLVDKNSNVTYSNFDLIVIAGRPGNVGSANALDSFVANIPVNNIPTVAIDAIYPPYWGWVKPQNLGTVSSTQKQKIYITDTSTSITQDYSQGDVVVVHVAYNGYLLDIQKDLTKLKTIAAVDVNGYYGTIAVAEPETQLFNGKTTRTRVVFFGITYPSYWTEEAENLFKKSVIWVLSDFDGDGILDYKDNCPFVFNPDQRDSDGDSVGDVCDLCPSENAYGLDKNRDGCIDDTDGDGIKDNIDNCPTIYNPNQSDKDRDGKGDVCDILPGEIVYLDVDSDGINETATNKNNIPEDGYEFYGDPNDNTRIFALDGDKDGMTDFLIDIDKNRTYEKYWDPDDMILTDIIKIDSFYYIDTNGDGYPDLIFDDYRNAIVVLKDVDSDTRDEQAFDINFDGSFDEYKDPDGSSKLLNIKDGDKDNKNDFLIDINLTDLKNKPHRYWDPDDVILTDILEKDADNDGDLEFIIDVNEDGRFERVYDNRALFDSPDLVITSLILNPDSPIPGSDVQIKVTVNNTGEYDAMNFKVEFLLDGISKQSKTISLKGHKSAFLDFEWNDTPEGAHELRISVDSGNVITESNEDNNIRIIDVGTPVISSISSGAGGRTSKTTLPPSGTAYFINIPETVEIELGESKTISGKFENRLNYNIYNVTFFLRGEGLSARWYSLSPEFVNEIKNGESKDIAITFTMPEDAPIYTYPMILRGSVHSEYGTKTFSKEFNLLVKENVTASTTTTTIPTEEKPSRLTGLVTFVRSNFIAIILGMLVIVLLLIWRLYPKLFGKGGFIVGKGWKQPKKKQ
jgi:hypothetical protein